MIKRIKVKLGVQSYNIFIKNDLLKMAGRLIKGSTGAKAVVILSVKPVFEKYGNILSASLRKAGMRFNTILIPDGETQKNEGSLLFILKKMAQLGLQRDSCLIAFGGGVIGDLGGFAASIYMRGIDFIQCPTTLLAQVDASVGGKTAIDFAGIKNLIGTFYQPKLVLIDPVALETLDKRQFKTGLAEIIKYGVIQDEKLFEKIENYLGTVIEREPVLLSFLIARSCEIKARIISEDEKENGKRALLNYGHTLGHAFESYFQYKILTHGEAIAYGMLFASRLSHQMGLCPKTVVQRQSQLLKRAGLFRKLPPFNPQKVCEKMFLNKKARNGQIQFILTRKIGLVTIQKNVPQSLILSALNQLQADVSELY
jgi:3-dehydroquinate synthase